MEEGRGDQATVSGPHETRQIVLRSPRPYFSITHTHYSNYTQKFRWLGIKYTVLHVRPANQSAITVVAVCQKMLDSPVFW